MKITVLSRIPSTTVVSDNEQTAEARYLIAYIYYVRRDLEVAQQLCLNANGRYATDEELMFFQNYLKTAQLRFSLYQKIQSIDPDS